MNLSLPAGLEGNIWKYTVLLVVNKRVFVAVLGAYYLTVPGVTPWWIGVILLVSNIAGFLFEIPSGYIADKVGHKQTLVVSRVLVLLSTVFLLFSMNVWWLILGGAFLSLGHAFQSGTGSAFMHETLRALGRMKEYRGIMGRAGSIGFGVPIVFMVGIPFLVGIDWKLPFVISLVTDVLGLLVALSLRVPTVSQEHVDEVNATNFLQVMREGHRLHYFRYAAFSGILAGTMTGIGSFRAVYQDFLDIPVIWYGVFFGIGRALASGLLWKTEWIQSKIGGRPTVYLWKFGLFLSLLIFLWMFDEPWVVVVLFMTMNAAQWGLSQVGYSIEAIEKSRFKATLLSVKSQINTFAFGLSAFVFGIFAEWFSYRLGFLLFAGALFVISVPLFRLILHDAKRRKESGLDGDDGGGDA